MPLLLRDPFHMPQRLGWLDAPLLSLLVLAAERRAAGLDAPTLALLARTLQAAGHAEQKVRRSGRWRASEIRRPYSSSARHRDLAWTRYTYMYVCVCIPYLNYGFPTVPEIGIFFSVPGPKTNIFAFRGPKSNFLGRSGALTRTRSQSGPFSILKTEKLALNEISLNQ